LARRFDFRRLAELGERAAEHPLAGADGAAVPGGRLEVWLGPKIVGGRYFRLLLDDGEGTRRFVEGLHGSGPYPGRNWAEIFDIELPPRLRGEEEWELELAPYLRPLAEVIPPGGHLMIEYEKPLWRTTQLGLLAGIPPLATPLGGLLYELGAGSSFKDWYFPEGGQEGGRKLQGNKPLSAEHAAETAQQRAGELRGFLESPPRGDPEIDARARRQAHALLERLPS
jgi:hypothetical protein